MTSFTNNIQEFFERLKTLYNVELSEIDSKQFKIIAEPDKILPLLAYLKEIGYSHLSILTCVDWIEQKKFELVYILFNWSNGITFLVSTFIDRDKPVFYTVKDMWPTAEYYERDVHEFFGVEFEGNENCKKPMILELWNDLPPLRKDFDPLKYSKEHYPDREYEKDAIHEARIVRGDIRGDVNG
ncbi:MAG: NADH-quinone oxidoreductase subunit C [Fervidobacterium sp.]